MLDNNAQKNIGIWGYGAVGKSFIRYLQKYQPHAQLHLFDDRMIASESASYLSEHHIRLYTPDEKNYFFDAIDVLLPSPGIRLPQLPAHITVINEYNLFCQHWQGKIIGITGTIGKTTVTSLMSHLLHTAQYNVATGGNIGIPMLDLLKTEETAHHTAVLELSSFQLEQGITQGPNLAIITNCYPNHLDRHDTFEAYLAAKMNMVIAQTAGQRALLPLALAAHFPKTTSTSYAWFSDEPLSSHDIHRSLPGVIFWRDGNAIIRSESGQVDENLTTITNTLSFPENWLITYAALSLLKVPVPSDITTLNIPEHRLTHTATHHAITFYNDSKSTVPQATFAAITKLYRQHQKPIVLFLGGLSKGVSRRTFIHSLKDYAFCIITFGSEAAQLSAWATEAGITSLSFATLESAFHTYTHHHAQPHDIVLFSPSGSSYDLFHDFQERGNCFVKLVHDFANN